MKKFIKWFFSILFFIIFASVIALVVFVANFDLNQYKPQIEKIVLEQTGRKLTLNGDIGIKISLIPTISADDLSLSNALWAGDEPMVKIKEADVSFAVLPLLSKNIEIADITLIDPVVNLSMNKDGVGNWVFEKPLSKDQESGVQKEAKEEKIEPVNGAAAPLLAGFFAEKIEIKNGVVRFEDLSKKSVMTVELKSVLFSSEDEDEDISLAFDVLYNNEPFKGQLTGDSLNQLLKAKPYQVHLTAEAYRSKIETNALLTDIFGDIGYKGDIALSSPDNNFGLPKTELNADIEGTLQAVQAKLKKLDLGGNVVTGNVNVNLASSKPVIKGNIQSKSFDISRLTPKQQTAWMDVLIKKAHAASYVPSGNLDLSALNMFDAFLNIDIADLIINEDISLQNVKGTVNIQKGVLSISPLSLNAGGGDVNGFVTLNTSTNNLQLKLDGKNVVLQNLMKNLQAKGDNFGFENGGMTNLYINLATQGKSYQSLYENLKGQVLLNVGESKIYSGSLKYLKGNFLGDLLSALQIQAKDPNMKMKCAVLRADFGDGKVKFPKGIAFDSKKMTIVGDGDVNLKNDKINIAIKPFNGNLADTNIAQAVSSLIKVRGTVDKPGIAIDTANVVKNAIGVALTGPAFIGSQLLLDADPAPCYTALKGTVFSNAYEAPQGVKAGAQKAYQGTSNAVSGGINAVTGTADAVVGKGVNILSGTAKGVMNMLGSSKKSK